MANKMCAESLLIDILEPLPTNCLSVLFYWAKQQITILCENNLISLLVQHNGAFVDSVVNDF
jgi:hypothetical protein